MRAGTLTEAETCVAPSRFGCTYVVICIFSVGLVCGSTISVDAVAPVALLVDTAILASPNNLDVQSSAKVSAALNIG